MKLAELIARHNELNQALQSNEVWYSFELFPPKTEKGREALRRKLNNLAELEPLIVDITWGAGGSSNTTSLRICKRAQQLHGLNTMLHLTCMSMTREELKQVLQSAKEKGIQNILALRGDVPQGGKKVDNGLNYAVDLVKFIKNIHKDYFGICVAGYPEGHGEAESFEKDLFYLKQKVDAGADMIITQMFFDPNIFLNYKKKCREIGIKCPIIPGIMPIMTYSGFMRMTKFTKVTVPKEITEGLEKVKDDKVKVVDFGVSTCVKMCQQLILDGVEGIHIYCLNQYKPVERIIKGLSLRSSRYRRSYPWRRSTIQKRRGETIRPVFWAYRPESYIYLTNKWESFPKQEWNDNNTVRKFRKIKPKILKKVHPWGSFAKNRPVNSIDDVTKIFKDFVTGEISSIPWVERRLNLTMQPILEKIVFAIKNKILIINFQPRLNGILSENQLHGFGGPGGYIYQKRYIEFFISPDRIKLLVKLLKASGNLHYHATNCDGSIVYTNNTEGNVITVTWAVFPGKPIIQPVIVDPKCFQNVWRKEAFDLWIYQWRDLFIEGTKSWKTLQEIRDTYFLVNVVDNDFTHHSVETEYNIYNTLKSFFIKEKQLESQQNEQKLKMQKMLEIEKENQYLKSLLAEFQKKQSKEIDEKVDKK
ncbi:methylenetetrahydrofolate reductase [Anaeramoeba flamelloides]|uniref:methylenetetrahydrofolate reductase (NADH) n=1 Tax=Anaeramoeba flamelloides TaxID=1746091 RepID=A0ABQ8X817_9EUKA|nr:methylenetetrahydrofolate reductase [Anaeramoeba flamelloides]